MVTTWIAIKKDERERERDSIVEGLVQKMGSGLSLYRKIGTRNGGYGMYA